MPKDSTTPASSRGRNKDNYTMYPQAGPGNFIRRLIFLALAGCCLYLLLFNNNSAGTLEEVPLTDVISRANDENGDIKSITVLGNRLEITLKGQESVSQISQKDASGTLYEQGLIDHCANYTGDLLKACQEKYPAIEYKDDFDTTALLIDIATIALPLIAVFVFFSDN